MTTTRARLTALLSGYALGDHDAGINPRSASGRTGGVEYRAGEWYVRVPSSYTVEQIEVLAADLDLRIVERDGRLGVSDGHTTDWEYVASPSKQFTPDNWGSSTQAECDIANAAIDTLIADYSAADLEDGEILKSISDRVNNAWKEGNTTAELVAATRRQGAAVVLFERVLGKSGLSLSAFAQDVMVRDERTVRRWRSGKTAIPAVAVRRLEQLARA